MSITKDEQGSAERQENALITERNALIAREKMVCVNHQGRSNALLVRVNKGCADYKRRALLTRGKQACADYQTQKGCADYQT